MTILVTGAAGFIGFHVAQALLARGERVLGIDNLNSYYDPTLKHARLAVLAPQPRFAFEAVDIADRSAMEGLRPRGITRIVHLAAQAGVRHSLVDPYAYVAANLLGQVTVLELARALPDFQHLVYASSSSVYGLNEASPFAVGDRTDRPASLYGATKKADELMGHAYAHLFRIPMTGLRFFTVYGPWGRPDMAAWLFTDAILAGRPITLFNQGQLQRDFTYIDDIVAGVLAALDRPPAATAPEVPVKVYNLGNNRPEPLSAFVSAVEAACGIAAQVVLAPMQPGDVLATAADITESTRDLGFRPVTPISVGIPRFVEWFRAYHQR